MVDRYVLAYMSRGGGKTTVAGKQQRPAKIAKNREVKSMPPDQRVKRPFAPIREIRGKEIPKKVKKFFVEIGRAL